MPFKDREKRKQYERKYRQTHTERLKEYRKEYREKHRETLSKKAEEEYKLGKVKPIGISFRKESIELIKEFDAIAKLRRKSRSQQAIEAFKQFLGKQNIKEETKQDVQINVNYVAGFIDGEGCLSISRSQREGYLNHTPSIQVSNTNLEILEKIRDFFGSGSIHRTGNGDAGNRKESFCLVWAGNPSCLKILDVVEPYLIVKSRHAKILRRWCESRWGYGKTGHGKRYTEVELNLCKELQVLNHRGRKIELNCQSTRR